MSQGQNSGLKLLPATDRQKFTRSNQCEKILRETFAPYHWQGWVPYPPHHKTYEYLLLDTIIDFKYCINQCIWMRFFLGYHRSVISIIDMVYYPSTYRIKWHNFTTNEFPENRLLGHFYSILCPCKLKKKIL